MGDKDDTEITALTAALAEEEATEREAPKSVEVVAPSDLPGGFALKCMLSGREFFVEVPDGGVKEGELFVGDIKNNPLGTPYGQWRDGTCDCMKHGFCHAMCWFAFLCPYMVLGQVQTRESLNCCGRPGKPPSTSNTFIFMVFLSILLYAGHISYDTFARPYWHDLSNPEGSRLAVYISYWVYLGLCILFMLCTVTSTRRSIRSKYRIPGNFCEDFWCTAFCTPCIVCQAARHTYDYEKYPVPCCSRACCSKTGMSDSAPKIV